MSMPMPPFDDDGAEAWERRERPDRPIDPIEPIEPVTASEYFQRGLELFEDEQYPEALAHIDRALAENYFGVEVCLVKGELLLELKRFTEALAWFEKAQELRGPTPEVLTWKGIAFCALKRYPRGLSCFNRVLAQAPRHPEALLKKAMALFELGEDAKARSTLTLARESNTDAPNPEREAEIDYWLAKLERRSGHPDVARTILEEVLRLNHDHLASYAELADIYRVAGDLSRARELYVRGLRRDRHDAALHNDYGNLLRDLQDLVGSKRELSQAIDANPDHEVAYYNRGLTHEELGDHASALADFREALRIDPEDIDAHLRVIHNLLTLERVAEAAHTARELNARLPDDRDVLATYSEIIRQQALGHEAAGQYADAAQLYRELLDRAPEFFSLAAHAPHFASPEARLKAGYRAFETLATNNPAHADYALLAGIFALKLNELSTARQWLTEALDRKPGAYAHFGLGVLAVQEGRASAALCQFDAALSVRPDFIEAYAEKALVLEEEPLNDLAGAIACYERIRELAPEAVWVLAPLGELYERTGDYERALQAYREHLGYLRHDGEDGPDVEGLDSWRQAVAQAELALGRVLLELQRPEVAIEHLKRASAGQLSSVELPERELYTGMAWHDLGNLPAAEIALTAARDAVTAESDPELRAAALSGLASIALKRRNFAAGHAALEEAAALVGSTPDITLGRASLFFEARRFDEAREQLERVLISRSDREPPFHQALYLRAKVAYHQRHYELGLAALKELLADDPYYVKAWQLKVWLALAAGDVAEAEAAEAEFQFLARFVRGLHWLNDERYERAAAYFAALQADAPERGDVRFYRACALVELQRLREGMAVLETALKLDPRLRPEAETAPALDALRRTPAFAAMLARVPRPSPMRAADASMRTGAPPRIGERAPDRPADPGDSATKRDRGWQPRPGRSDGGASTG